MRQEVYKTIDDFLQFLKKNGDGSIFNMENPRSTIGTNAIGLIKKYSLVHYRSNEEWKSIIDLSLNGEDCISVGGIENYIKIQETGKETSKIHIGNIINSDLNQSRLEANINLPTNAHNITNTPNNNKTSTLEKLYWLAGIVIAIIAVYEFYLKYHLSWK
jgi:hypothetical protein